MFDVFVRMFKLFNSKSDFTLLLIQREERTNTGLKRKESQKGKKARKEIKGDKAKHIFHCKTDTFDMFVVSRSIHVPIKCSLLFHVFSKPFSGTVLEGPGADLYWKI